MVFTDYAELTQGMKDGVLRGMRALLAENGRLAANGARRTDGEHQRAEPRHLLHLQRLRAAPDRAAALAHPRPRGGAGTWNKRIEYRDAVLDIYGVPVAYFPYLTHADPSVKRASGFLVPDARPVQPSRRLSSRCRTTG